MNRLAWNVIAAAAARAPRLKVLVLFVAALPAAGCKTDLSQQLLERELRMQEDQIYLLQDQLQEKCARLDRAALENQSLKRQLGIVDPDASLPTRGSVPPGVAAPARLPTPAAPPAMVPPAITLPEPTGVPPVGAGGNDGPSFAPPSLDGVPPLPDEPNSRGAAATDPTIKRLSHEESLSAEGQISHIVVNPTRTECFDGNGDGTSDGLAVVFEPRDADERLVTAAGDVSIAAFDPTAGATGEGVRIAAWEIASAEAMKHFRRTSRARGLHFTLPWQGTPPSGDHLRVFVRLTTFDGKHFEADATVPVR